MAMGTELRREVLSELQWIKRTPFKAHADMDYVWAISAPGTVFNRAPDNTVYAGEKPDLLVVRHAFQVVRAITAKRIGLEPSDVTMTDMRIDGPMLYYNSEDTTTENWNFPQNQHLLEWAEEPDFPIPRENLIVDTIDSIGTHEQVKGINRHLAENPRAIQVAAVAMAPHSCRVGRLIEAQKEDIPEGVRYVLAAAPLTNNVFAKILSEMAKIETYVAKGDCAEQNYFFSRHEPKV